MKSWEEIVQRYIIRYQSKIRRVTQPLRDFFDIDYFTYHRIDNKGHYSVLLDRPDWAEHYVTKQFYANDPYLRHPSVYQSGVCFMETNGSDAYKNQVLKDGIELFQMDTCMVYIDKSEDCVEFYCCAGQKRNGGVYNLYMNELGLLKAFSRHFKHQLSRQLNELKEAPSFLQTLKGNDFFDEIPINSQTNSIKRETFLQKIGLSDYVSKVSKLSRRERECLSLHASGKNAKDSGLHLGISPRTVETYFENIKNKLDCLSKHQTFDIAKELMELGLLEDTH